jgi:DNA sulfur modification protein DndD
MKLEYVRLENFRQYYGEQAAEFSTQDDLNVTVFHGLNGTGKTSLFSAINWCLYGVGAEEIGELTNKAALSEVSDGETVRTSVSVSFRHEAYRYLAQRSIETQKSGKTTHILGPPNFKLSRIMASGDAKPEPNPSLIMNSILPENVRPYFFFDGEKMDDLTRADNSEVEKAVRNVMRLPALERAHQHLEKVAGELRVELKKQGSPELEKLIEQEENLRTKRESSVKRRDELKEEIRLSKQRVDELEERLREKAGAKLLQNQRDQLQSSLAQLENQRGNQLKSIQEVVNHSYISLLGGAAETSLNILDEKRERGEIPSGIREQFVKDLLEQMVCICGRPFSEHDEVYDTLHKLLRTTSATAIENEVLGLAGTLRVMSTRSMQDAARLSQQRRDYDAVEAHIEQQYKALEEIKHQLSQISEEDIAGLERQRAKFQREFETNVADLRSTEDNIKVIDSQIEELRHKKRAAEAKEQKLLLLTRKERIAQDAADAIARINEQFFEYTRREIEAATKEVFDRLAWKQDHFQDVRLDQDFHMEVIDRWQTPTRKELSAGERQILSLAFICAMSKVAGEDAPLVMDTPFGRLSGNHLSTVAENLPDLTSQLILFVTDREWDEASRTNLEPRTGAQYQLKFDNQTGCTQISEVAWL